jgi:hypothetical protein
MYIMVKFLRSNQILFVQMTLSTYVLIELYIQLFQCTCTDMQLTSKIHLQRCKILIWGKMNSLLNLPTSCLGQFRAFFNLFSSWPLVQSRAINFDRQCHSLTQWKMLHCKTVVNILTYHHVV